jgi:hypothetical protein
LGKVNPQEHPAALHSAKETTETLFNQLFDSILTAVVSARSTEWSNDAAIAESAELVDDYERILNDFCLHF